MKKLLYVIVMLVLFPSVFAMPSATRHRFNAYVMGGSFLISDTYLYYEYGELSESKIDYRPGALFLTGLEYNTHNRISLGLESGYQNIGYKNEAVSTVPFGLNVMNDESFQQGLIVLRLGFNFSYVHVLYNKNIDYGTAFGPQLSLTYEILDELHIAGNIRYLCLSLNDKRYTHGVTMIPVSCGIIIRI